MKAMLSPRRACIRYEQLGRENCTRRRAWRYRQHELHAQTVRAPPHLAFFSNLQCKMIFYISDQRIGPRHWGGSLENHHLTRLSIRLEGRLGRVLRQGWRIVIFGVVAAPHAPFTMREVLQNQ